MRGCGVCVWAVVVCLMSAVGNAQEAGSVTGTVEDPLGGRVAGATVTLRGETGDAGKAASGADGVYVFRGVAPGRYQVVVDAAGFEAFTSESRFAGAGGTVIVNATLRVGPLQQAVVVTAAASALPQSQTGAPITVIDEQMLDALNKPDLLESLRLVAGSYISQNGARGSTATFFIRGGNSNFNKVLVDGIPANNIGGDFDFAQLSTSGVEQVEVLRQTNSVRYGSDALAGVVSIITRRGRARIPEFEYSLDGGNLGTISTGALIGGAVRRVDYFSTYSRFETDNDVPNNDYRNQTYAGRFGVALGRGTDLSASVRRIDVAFGSPDGFSLFRIADDTHQTKEQTFVTAAAQSQWTGRWQSTVRVGWTDEQSAFVNPAATGIPFDPFGFGANYLGETVTLTGANGFSTTGRAVLDFGGVYPSLFDTRASRQVVLGDTHYQMGDGFSISAGARYEREQGFDDPTGDPVITRNNGGVFVEGRATLMNRHYINAGLGYERNEVFESAVTPRISVASYLREPASTTLGETKLTLNAGTGIKAPNVFQEQNALLALVQGTPLASTVGPVGPERSRSVDVGVEQGLMGSAARVRVSYFHNTFTDLLEFLSRTSLPRAGVPANVAAAAPFGAYVNAASFRASGIEMSSEAALGDRLRVNGSYTFLDAEVKEAFSASVSFNPAFPGIPIGAFSPLVGERPFRRPAHSGHVMLMYVQGPAQVAVSAHVVGTRDDSTFLSDPFFGTSMLLPNQNLAAAYQKVDLSGAYQVHPRLRGYASIENLFDQAYEASFGFPSLPMTARIGFRLTLGGDPIR